jgi:signal-transduction protein with cAMP-binding, CBS, and nucleotidyltransferase domain
MLKSTFFTELHMKDKKAHQFYENCTVECYFQGQVIQEAGSEEKAFYLMFKGDLEEENHIYVREHNKWPLPNRRWEVRAVYNSYNQNKHLKRFNFFGDEELMENLKFKARYLATTWTVLLKMKEEDFYLHLNQEDIKRLKKYRSENADVNYLDF